MGDDVRGMSLKSLLRGAKSIESGATGKFVNALFVDMDKTHSYTVVPR